MSIFGCSKEKALHISRHFQGPFLCFFSSSRRNVSSFKNSKCNLAINITYKVNLDKHEIDTHGEERRGAIWGSTVTLGGEHEVARSVIPGVDLCHAVWLITPSCLQAGKGKQPGLI